MLTVGFQALVGTIALVDAISVKVQTLGLVLVVLTGGIVGLIGLTWLWTRDLPQAKALDGLIFRVGTQQPSRWPPPSITGSVFTANPVALNEISTAAQKAIVSSEDRHFYEHAGFDPIGLVRSVLETAQGHRQGGSTITQQLVRSTILTPEDSLKRKVQELWLSSQLEQRLSKEEILTGYLNTVYWGGQTLGIRAAARTYFGESPQDLTLAQAVYLAALLPAPNARYANFRLVREHDFQSRLERLVQDWRVTKREANAAWLEPLEPVGWQVRYDGTGRLKSASFSDPREGHESPSASK